MQQPGSGQIKKPHKHQELCGFFCSKPKLFATYILHINSFLPGCQGKKAKKRRLLLKSIFHSHPCPATRSKRRMTLHSSSKLKWKKFGKKGKFNSIFFGRD
jgi:hypothetical protein